MRIFAIFALTSLMGCLGAAKTTGGAGGGTTTTTGTNPVTGAACTQSTPPRRVWMLSRKEYDATVAAVLGDTSNSAQANFPPEDRSNGFVSNEAALVVDTNLMNQIESVAESVAANRAAAQAASLGCTPSTSPSASTPDACISGWISNVGAALYRRPLTASESSDLWSAYVTGFTNPYDNTSASTSGVELAMTAMLESPQFLYRTELGDPADTSSTVTLTQYEIAQALSYIVTGGPPDATLTGLAAQSQLNTPAALLAQYKRLVATDGGHARIESFFLEWLSADSIANMGSASSALTPSVAADMVTETQKMVEEAIFNGSGTFKEVLTADYTFVNAELASYYGISAPTETDSTGFGKVTGNSATQKLGILSQGSWLATSSTPGVPILHRGALLREKLLCETLPSVASLGLPNFVPPPLGTPAQGQTTRDLLENTVAQGTVCYTCHQYFMPMGYGLSNFDPLGRYQSTENGGAIDPSGFIAESDEIDPASGLILDPQKPTDTNFADFNGLVQAYASSPEVDACFSKQMFTFASGRTDVTNNECDVADLQKSYDTGGTNVLDGFEEYVQSTAFSKRAR